MRIAISCGDPAGIGAEAALKALAYGLPEGVETVLIGPPGVWEAASALVPGGTGLAGLEQIDPGGECEADWAWGIPTVHAAEVAARAIERGVQLALDRKVDALVTAPISKQGLREAGRPFPGHTEFLEHLCGGRQRATMMLAGARLRVILVTTHLALREVPAAITREAVLAAVLAADSGLRGDLGIPRPRIGVAALNPHAGEGGVLGSEEELAITPALEVALSRGVAASGPWPADSLFHRAARGEFDAVVAMYHDQGLGPLKLLHFHDGVNVTLGLPIVRTSPDHGTAYDIAGRGTARADSFREALRWASRIARRRRQGEGRSAAGADGNTGKDSLPENS